MSKKIALCGIYVALALVFSYVESLISLGGSIAGIKVGLANVVVIVALYTSGKKDAVIVNIPLFVINVSLF